MKTKWNAASWVRRMSLLSAVRPNESRGWIALMSQKNWEQLEPELALAIENRNTVEEFL